jgi:Putative beta-barrel porin 2
MALFSVHLALAPRAPALISIDDGRQKIFVSLGASVTEDSNVFMNNEDRHDLVFGTSVNAKYVRRAGWIGVNAAVSLDSSRFSRLREQDFDNPSFRLELLKQGGRTTGSFNLSASRESRADAEVNTRSTYWNIPLGLNVRYPLAGAYTLSTAFGYSERNYLDEATFASLRTYSMSADALRITSSVREIFAGYRYRFSETSRNSSSVDHALSVGLNGKLIRGLNGSLRAGLQTRGSTGRAPGNDRFTSWFASGTTSYDVSRKLSLSGSITKDFSTTATDDVVDSLNVSLSARYAATAKLGMELSSSLGTSDYVGQAAANLPSGAAPSSRSDRFVSANLSVSYSFNEHLQSSATYSQFWNTSSFELADFARSTWSANISSRW